MERSTGPGVLGLDEAGRGSLIGPLVVGGFLVPEERLSELPALGVRDSKLLSAARREEIYRSLSSVGRAFRIAADPAEVDRSVRHRGLNRLELRLFSRLVARARPRTVFADACDPVASRFAAQLGALAGEDVEVRASHHADRDIPVVGAASIVAKVERDRAIARLARRLDAPIGSGYPSDRRTVEYVRQLLASGTPAPPWLRQSWRTTERLKRETRARRLESFSP